MKGLHIYTVTAAQPFANYGGETEPGSNVTPLQKLVIDGAERLVVSGQAVRAMIRDRLAEHHPTNRRRDPSGKTVLAAAAEPDPDAFADDFGHGFLVPGKEKRQRRSAFEVGISVATVPIQASGVETLMHQAPAVEDGGNYAALYHQEVQHVAFVTEYRFRSAEWLTPRGRTLLPAFLGAIWDPGPVGGKHSRCSYSWAPVTAVVAATTRCSVAPLIDSNGEIVPLAMADVIAEPTEPRAMVFFGALTANPGPSKMLADIGAIITTSPRTAIEAGLRWMLE